MMLSYHSAEKLSKEQREEASFLVSDLLFSISNEFDDFSREKDSRLDPKFIEGLFCENGKGIICFEGNVLVGVCLIRPTTETDYELMIAVHKEYRRKGVAVKMMEMIISKARDIEVKKMHLLVSDKNKSAISLYNLVGFRILGNKLVDGFKGGRCVNMYIMQLEL